MLASAVRDFGFGAVALLSTGLVAALVSIVLSSSGRALVGLLVGVLGAPVFYVVVLRRYVWDGTAAPVVPSGMRLENATQTRTRALRQLPGSVGLAALFVVVSPGFGGATMACCYTCFGLALLVMVFRLRSWERKHQQVLLWVPRRGGAREFYVLR